MGHKDKPQTDLGSKAVTKLFPEKQSTFSSFQLSEHRWQRTQGTAYHGELLSKQLFTFPPFLSRNFYTYSYEQEMILQITMHQNLLPKYNHFDNCGLHSLNYKINKIDPGTKAYKTFIRYRDGIILKDFQKSFISHCFPEEKERCISVFFLLGVLQNQSIPYVYAKKPRLIPIPKLGASDSFIYSY